MRRRHWRVPTFSFIRSSAITTALALEVAAQRFADIELPAGVLVRTDNDDNSREDYTHEELAEIGDAFEVRRRSHTTAVLQGFRYDVPSWDADQLQMTAAREHSALELARICNVPPWTVGAPSGSSMTYSNAAWSRLDLLDYGAAAYLVAFQQTLSGPNVTPRGTYINFDQEAWLNNPLLSQGATVPKPLKPGQP